MVRLNGYLANGTFPYLIRKDQPKNLLLSFIFFLLMEKSKDLEATWLESMADRPDRDPCGTLSFLMDLCSLTTPTICPFVPLFCHRQMSLSSFRMTKNLFLLFWFCPFCFHGVHDVFVFLENQNTAWFSYDPPPLASSSICFGKEKRERKRMIYFMYWPPLRPSRILIVKA